MTPNPERRAWIDYGALNDRLDRLRQLDQHSDEYKTLEIELFGMLYPIFLSLAHGRETQAEDARTELLMRLRQGKVQFFSGLLFQQCLADAGREAFRGLPRRPKDENEKQVQVVSASERLLSVLPASGGVVDGLVEDEEHHRQEKNRRRLREKLETFRATLSGKLLALYQRLWSGDLSWGWKGAYAQQQRVGKPEISRRLKELDKSFKECLGSLDELPSLEELVRQLREDVLPPDSGPKGENHE